MLLWLLPHLATYMKTFCRRPCNNVELFYAHICAEAFYCINVYLY